ncbi:MAG: Gamma-glutamyltransferase [Firmicutes bacterium]|nr:Gamma-glutamyltransferase [Bacillota bacterium]
MDFDALSYPFPSKRTVVFAKNGMVATSQHLAAQSGLDILKVGGNAIDAAIAAAACLTVVEPTSNGIGGDAFALVWVNGNLYGLNSSGPSPQSISLDAVRRQGFKEMPQYGFTPVTVPGVPAAWAELSARFGRIPLSEVLKPAISYAQAGYPVSPIVSKYWEIAFKKFSEFLKGKEFASWFTTFAPLGRAPYAGEIVQLLDHAATLQEIGDTKGESFYRGSLAEKIGEFSRSFGGYLQADDLAAYKAEWVQPIKVAYRGYEAWEIPPNGHGLVALMALNILNGLQLKGQNPIDAYHKQIEAIKIAFADGQKYITDPKNMTVKVSDLLSEGYGLERRKLIGDVAILPEAGRPDSGGTVYLATADKEGNMVSYIQSNYMGFGSGLVVPGTGISLHNRGKQFSLDPFHVNRLEAGKKPYHTIIPGFLTKDNKALGPFGVMGAFMQPQGHVQLLVNMIDYKLNPQAALDAPRWQWKEGKSIDLEPGFPMYMAEALLQKGHIVNLSLETGSFGRGQVIIRQENGTFAGGTEGRADSAIAAW